MHLSLMSVLGDCEHMKHNRAMRTSILKLRLKFFPVGTRTASYLNLSRMQPMPFKSQGRHLDAFMFVWNPHDYWRRTPGRRWTKMASSHY